jgi:uridine kinase
MNQRGTPPLLVGIAGATGSGKSILAKFLAKRYEGVGALILEQDSYYRDQSHLRVEERDSLNYDEPGAIDHELLLMHIQRLKAGESFLKPIYCFATHTRKPEGEPVRARPLVLVEGLFSLWYASIRAQLNLKVFVEADSDLRFIRRLRRDVFERGRTVDSVIAQYLNTVRPMQEVYVLPTKHCADLVVSNNDSLEEPLRQISQAISLRLAVLAEQSRKAY